MTPEVRLLCTGARSNVEDRVLGKAEKDSFIVLPSKGDTPGSCPKPGGLDEEFYKNTSRVGLLTRLGCVQGLRWLVSLS